MTIQSTNVWTHRRHGAGLSAIAASGMQRLSNTIAAFRERRKRRAAIRELQRWSDHMLADIGLTRGIIPAAVDGIMRREAEASAAKEPADCADQACRTARRPRQYDAMSAGLTVVHPTSPRAECC